VGNCSRCFYGEAEISRNRIAPSLPGFDLVRTIERGIDFACVKQSSVPPQMVLARIKIMRRVARNIPASRTNSRSVTRKLANGCRAIHQVFRVLQYEPAIPPDRRRREKLRPAPILPGCIPGSSPTRARSCARQPTRPILSPITVPSRSKRTDGKS